MAFSWVEELIKVKELYGPFSVKNDASYYSDLCAKYKILCQYASSAGADSESLRIINKYTNKVKEVIRDYYKGNITSAHNKIQNLVRECISTEYAVSSIIDCPAFAGEKESEIQFFRARDTDVAKYYDAKDMLHLPFKLRGKTGNYRFSIPGVPSLYLGNSSYACWLELGRPPEHRFNVSPVILDGSQKVFNLAIISRDLSKEDDENVLHVKLRLLILMIACSYRIDEPNRNFKSEYIVSQSIMLACKNIGLDGIVYYSKQIDNELFSGPAINIALFATYKYGQEYSDICSHIKIDDSFNFSVYKQLGNLQKNKKYALRSIRNPYICNIVEGRIGRQYSYSETEFCQFDQFLFASWDNKEALPWGNALI